MHATRAPKKANVLAIPKETVKVLVVRSGVRGGRASSYKPTSYKPYSGS